MTPILYSYVVDHDHGYAPNPEQGLCSLVHCKFSGNGKRRNVVEKAEVGDWILGSGGVSRSSAGNDRIIYLMRVDRKIPFAEYLSSSEFHGRVDCRDAGRQNIFALLSQHYFYFGRNALDKANLPTALAQLALFKKGPGFRADLPLSQVRLLTQWFDRTFKTGVHGQPCDGRISGVRTLQRPQFKCGYARAPNTSLERTRER
jgi:hypothetical protein